LGPDWVRIADDTEQLSPENDENVLATTLGCRTADQPE
jgi:hypothetical protein